MTKLLLFSGVLVYTALPVEEVRKYLQKGYKAGVIDGFTESDGTIPIYINAASIEYIYK